ncbi:MAG: hypothetical protein WAN32_00945, partial [Candidatus Acidiferrum sp.]
STILVLWLVGVLVFATILNWTVSARSFLPVAPAAADNVHCFLWEVSRSMARDSISVFPKS